MQIFGSFVNFLARRPAAITVLFLYALDQIFGDVTFECPCTLPNELREHFGWALLICPALMIVLIDTPWSLLFSIIKVRYCCCQEACGGALMAVIPPMGFSLAWIFLFMESKQFSVCINTTNNVNQTGCIEDYNSTQYNIRITTVVLLYLMTSALCLRAFMQMCAPFCNRCCKSKCESGCRSHCESPCISCCNWLCKSCCSSCCSSCCTSCCKSCCASCCNSCCDCLTIHPNSGLLTENLSFSTYFELKKEHLLIEDKFLKGYPVEAIDKVNIGQGQQIRLKNYINSLRFPGLVKSMKACNNKMCAQLKWTAPNGVKGQDSGYLIQYKLIDSKQGSNQQNGQQNRQQNESTARLSGLESNERYSIQIWVIQASVRCNSRKITFFSIEICTTESEGKSRVFTREASPSNQGSKFSQIEVTHDSVFLKCNLKEGDLRIIGYELQFKIVKNQNHVDVQQSKTEMSAEFSIFQANVPYRFEICACIGNIKGESSSVQIDGEGICSTPAEGSSQSCGEGICSTSAEGSSQSGGEPEMHKELLCDKCFQVKQTFTQAPNQRNYGSIN